MASMTLANGLKPTLLNLTPRLSAFSSLFRPSWSMPCEPSTSSASLQIAHETTSWTDVIPSLSSLWELLPPLVLTTPKKKTSRARRGKGMENKWLRNRTSELCAALSTVRADNRHRSVHCLRTPASCPLNMPQLFLTDQPKVRTCFCGMLSGTNIRWKAEARGDRPRVVDPAFEDYVPGTKWGGPSAPAA